MFSLISQTVAVIMSKSNFYQLSSNRNSLPVKSDDCYEIQPREVLGNMTSTKVLLACFATEGPPYDDGSAIATECFPAYIEKVLQSGVDEVIALTPRTLPDFLCNTEDAKYCTRPLNVPDSFRLLNYHHVGMGTWRAGIINRIVEMNEDGDIVIFHDPNWKKYPGILENFAPIARHYATAAITVANRNKIFAPPHSNLIHTVTRSVFERLKDGSKVPNSLDLLNNPAARCRCIVLQINPETREFAKSFFDACKIDENVVGGSDASLSNGGWPRSGFIHNAAEQAVFNALVYGRGLWDVTKDDWILQLSNIGSNDHDTGASELIRWAITHRGWRPY